MKNPVFWATTIFGIFGFNGCNQGEHARTYTEIAPQTPSTPATSSGDLLNASPIGLDVHWTLPPGWVQRDSASGVRAGSFFIPDSSLANMGEMDPGAVDVSITYFAGEAGGLNRNIQRWMGQISVKLDSAQLNDFVRKAERIKLATGQEALIIDLTTELSGDLTQDKTIFGVIVLQSSFTLFVKAMGERKRVEAARVSIRNFCATLKVKEQES